MENRKARKSSKNRILVPVIHGQKNENVVHISEWFSQQAPVLMLGIVKIKPPESLSTGVESAAQMRSFLRQSVKSDQYAIRHRVGVAHDAWQEILQVLHENPSIELLVLEWPHHFRAMSLKVEQVMEETPCNIAIVKGQFDKQPNQILIPMRGGPTAEAALRMSIDFARMFRSQITIQRVFKNQDQVEVEDENFRGLNQVLTEMPDIRIERVVSADTGQAILDRSCQSDLVILGTESKPAAEKAVFGRITDFVLNNCEADVIAIKTERTVPASSPQFGLQAISILVDKWFAENTFDAREFDDLDYLVARKKELGVSISLALPALNEEETIGNVVQIAKGKLMEEKPLLDEIILIDSDSTDHTCEIATSFDIPVFRNREILPQYGYRNGKGEVLWKSLYVSRGDIIIWVDTDIKNFSAKFVYGILGPLLVKDSIQFVKGFYKRPVMGRNGVVYPMSGGRVTELTSRPMLNLFYPQLSGIVQPLAGEYGGRRDLLEQLTFTSGYGVETSLLIDAYEYGKLASIGQVNLDERVHRNQPLQNLSKMSFAIIQTMLSKLERRYGVKFLEDINRSMKSIRYEQDRFYLEVSEIIEQERPPMITLPEYQGKFNRTEKAAPAK
jgi:glucosyl-3-phosphoglycerate synthase